MLAAIADESGEHNRSANAADEDVSSDAVLVGESAEIHGQKWSDRDGDGVRDPGEPGLNGWVIELFNEQGARVSAQTTADRDLDGNGTINPETERGLYRFIGLPAGTYTIGEILQAGWEQTSPRSSLPPDPNGWNVAKLSQLPISDFPGGNTAANDVTGYVSRSGREYAIIGLSHGTGYVEVTDPAHPVIVGFVSGADEPMAGTGVDQPGHPHTVAKNSCSTGECEGASTWRDIKTFAQYAYVTNEKGGGLQIIDLSQIDSGIVTEVSTLNEKGLRTAHNIAINPDSGFAYLTGANIANGGLVVVDVGSNPAAPTIVSTWTERYIHDAIIASYTSGPAAGREIAYGFAGRHGVKVVDVTNKTDMTTLATVPYPNVTYAHFGTLSEDLQYLFVNDELDERDNPDVATTTTYVLDVSTPASPVYVTSFTNGLSAIDHNLEARGNFLFEANYRSGLRVFDVSDVNHVRETGFYDTYPADDKTAFGGAWGVYSDLPSGVLLVSDMQSGLFVLDASAATGVPGTHTVVLASGEIVTGVDFGNHRPSTPTIIDDGDGGYSDTGDWELTPIVEGREGDVRFAAAGNGSQVATYEFSGLTPGHYQVFATWSAHPNRATNAPYTIRDGTTGDVLSTVLINQEVPPDDFADGGGCWEELAFVTVTGSELIVEISNAANQFVIADAIRIEPSSTPPPPPEYLIIDDGDAGYSDTGWSVSPLLEGRLNDLRYAPAGNGSQTATWTFTDLTPGNYTVAATWSAHSNRATDAPYTIYDGIGGQRLEMVRVDQEQVPDDMIANGSAWQYLAIVTISGNELVVELTNDANQYVIADAIRIERSPTPPPSAESIIVALDGSGHHTNVADALAGAQGGETILVKAGNHGALHVSGPRFANGLQFDSPVTIKSYDPNNRAVFNHMIFDSVRGINIDSINIRVIEDPTWRLSGIFIASGSSDFVIRNCDIYGNSIPGDPNMINYKAVQVREGSNVLIENSVLHNSTYGIHAHDNSHFITVRGNDFYDNLIDNMHMGNDISHIVIEYNYFNGTDPINVADRHNDNIQFHTAGATTPTRNVIIRGNTIIQNVGWSQSIFIRNESGVGLINFQIYDNLIVNSHLHGISIHGVTGASIHHNTVVWSGYDPGFSWNKPQILAYGTDIEVSHNVAMGFDLDAGVNSHHNVIVQRDNPNGSNHYTDAFVNGTVSHTQATAQDFAPRSGGVLDLGGGNYIGASPCSLR